jgi:predicted HTH transcriptional regulator
MIQNILAQNEGRTLEFKENTKSLAGIIKTVIAFANTAGGTIVIGVEDKTKKVVGIINALAEEERLASAISDSVAPFMIPNIEIQSYRKKELIIINVPHLAGPFHLKKEGLEQGTYVRVGSTNRSADNTTLDNLRLYTKRISFDEIPFVQGKTNLINWDALKKAFKKIDKEITESKAENLGLLVKQGVKICPSYGGILLYGLNRMKLFPNVLIRCVRFLGNTKAAPVLDSLDIESYLPHAVDEILHFITKNTFTSSEIGRIYREDIPQYPPIAVREAVINAIIHADYSLLGDSIMISVFDNHIEIKNPGGIPVGMTLERAISGSSSVRNRVIAKVFRELKLIELWGSGLQKIIQACTERGLIPPKFEDFFHEFKVTLYSTQIKKPTLDESQDKLINSLKKQKKLSTRDAAQLLGIDPRNARTRLKQLVAKGFIQKIGTCEKDPHGYYTLI